jgi:polyhydroxybutyrate depolymerase
VFARRSLALGIVLVAGAALLVSGPGGAMTGAADCRAGRTTLQVRTPDGLRTAAVQVPVRLRAPAPLVLAFHGTGGTGEGMIGYSGFGPLAERAGVVTAYPSSGPDADQWSLSENRRGDDDFALVDGIIDRLVRAGCADRARVYAVGVSNGGGFATRLGCDRSSRIAAVVSVAGDYGPLPPCRPDRPVSLLEIHGTADQAAPYAGRGGAGAVMPWLRAWAQRDGCPAQPQERTDGARVLRLQWAPCRAGTEVAHIRIAGGTHQWPGATPPDPGPPSPVSAAEEAWRFLAGKRLAAAGGAPTPTRR